ncbi:MAG: polyhydroxyalkanoate synthesis regulator [Candidatus Omnitrophica bacterium]|nr:polyhydroxyalkanoate synthesis regulator [Candidatus Omnitrophota bacterium]
MDIIKEMMELGLGMLVLTKENAEKITNDLVKKGKLQKKEGKDLLEGIIKKGKAQEKEIEASVAKIVSQTLTKLNVANKADISRLEKEIKKLKSHKK